MSIAIINEMLKEKPNQQISFKYIVNLCLISILFLKVS